MEESLGHIRIYFGKIVSVEDKQKLNRCQIKIPGFTDKLEESDLPWYYPFNGLNHLPVKNDTVPVLIFDENFSTAFYGNKIDLKGFHQTELDDEDYEHYLELFKRSIGDDLVQLTYTKSKGIEFKNSITGSTIETEKYLLFVKQTSITITEQQIDVGTNKLEYSLMGDKTVKHLHNIIKHQQEIINQMYNGFQTIIGACTNPFTIPIGTALTTILPTKAKHLSTNKQLDTEADTIQSDLVKIGMK